MVIRGAAALKLTDRDQWIGWSPTQRVERLERVVQNRRFLVLAATRLPNLVSRALATRTLPEHWCAAHGFAPLIAEIFTEIEQFEGACYKAAGWAPCGHTRGFARHRADFCQPHGRLKKLWVKSLHRNARPLLARPGPACRLYPTVCLHGTLVTADALHGENQTLRQIVEAGGDYLVPLKANQPKALALAQQVEASLTLLLPAKAPIPDHGWLDHRA